MRKFEIIYLMQTTKQFFMQQVLPILITAILSALITALQGCLAGYGASHVATSTVALSATLGGGLKTGHQIFINS